MLFPYTCRIVTPFGTVDLVMGIPPEALSAARERGSEIVTLLNGAGLPRTAEQNTVTRLKLTAPQDFGIPYAQKKILAQCGVGSICTVQENLTDREALTVWENAIVWAEPILPRLGGGQAAGDEWYGYTLEFIHTEAS
ncbi:hypothetical protein [Deinococcus ruber]|uniref:Uncharacterized protein n=1 Tax=Deinococcus ruber TaxID=1848197 RepID=A0A918CPA2_9DEIO|nr:hypothetical protein [Deinococcus ruber]GGR34135.1 hypothetical protein GCM10008957_50430 [Deinococcus ruber]